jgi:mannose-1-phosphate guanylyltransferase
MQIDVIVFAAGAGREDYPLKEGNGKKLLLADDRNSIFFMTVMRSLLLLPKRVVVIAKKEHIIEVSNEIEKVKRTDEYLELIDKNDLVFVVIAEPEFKGSLATVSLGAYILDHPKNSNVAVLFPSDQIITNDTPFKQSIKSAYTIAKKNYIVTLGVAPDEPTTAYGYIDTDNLKSKKWYTLKSFKGKPDLRDAERYSKNEDYYFNTGILIFRPSDYIHELNKNVPEVSQLLKRIVNVKVTDPVFSKVLGDIYNKLEPMMIEKSILERAKHVAVIPANFNWRDEGAMSRFKDCKKKVMRR